MCGIAGVVGWRGDDQAVDHVEAMCSMLLHRGPDDRQVCRFGPAVLGQTRLSIIDIEGGRQPLSNGDGSVTVVFNGEIYNYRELRSRLIGSGHQFTTESDTEVLVHLYEDRGVEMLEELNGMFAFALWDARSSTLFLARDRLGVKPLYYAERPGEIAFASEITALRRVPWVGGELDREALAAYLTLHYIPDPATPFDGVKKLPPGCFTTATSSGIHEPTTYWAPPPPDPAAVQDLDATTEELRALLQDSVRLQLRADVPVGISASGGIDSTAVMWAAKRNNVSIDAYLVEFDDLAVDTEYARLAAATTGMDLHEHRVARADADALLPRLVTKLDEPVADPSIVPCYLVCASARESVKVLLNGTGGDELFGGYPRYGVRSLLGTRVPAARLGLQRSLVGRWDGVDRALATFDYRQRYLRRISVTSEPAVRHAMHLDGQGPVSRRVNELFDAYPGADAAAAMMLVDAHLYLPGDLCAILDRMSMACSLEARVPLLDHRLAEFACARSGALRMRDGQMKWLLRRALRGEVPDRILDRPKQGFGPPVEAWLAGSLGDASRRLVLDPDACLAELCDRTALQRWVRPDSAPAAYRTWALLILELWLRFAVRGEELSAHSVEELATWETR